MKNILLLTAFATLLFACKKDDTAPMNDSRLAGTWLYMGTYINIDVNHNGVNEIVKGMSINNTGELTIDSASKSFHFSNYNFSINLPQTNILRTADKRDTTYITTYGYEWGITTITATYRVRDTDSLLISGEMGVIIPNDNVPPFFTDQYTAGYTVGWSADTLLLITTYRTIGLEQSTMKFVRK